MTITLNPGEIKQVNVALTPLVSGAVTVTDCCTIKDMTLNKWAPRPCPAGHDFVAIIHGKNESAYEVMFYLHAWFLSPSGQIVGEAGEDMNRYYNADKTRGLQPGALFGGQTNVATLSETGTWRVIAEIVYIPESAATPPVINCECEFEVA